MAADADLRSFGGLVLPGSVQPLALGFAERRDILPGLRIEDMAIDQHMREADGGSGSVIFVFMCHRGD
jgi:hypothetical protein